MSVILWLMACTSSAPSETDGSSATGLSEPTVASSDTATYSTGGGPGGGGNGHVPNPDQGQWLVLTIDMGGATVRYERDAAAPVTLETVYAFEGVGPPNSGLECRYDNYDIVSWRLDDGAEGAIHVPGGNEDYLAQAPTLPIDPSYPMKPSFWRRLVAGGEVEFLSGGEWSWVQREDARGMVATVVGAELCVGDEVHDAWTLDASACAPAGKVVIDIVGSPSGNSFNATHAGMLHPDGERLCVYWPDLVIPPQGTGGTGSP